MAAIGGFPGQDRTHELNVYLGAYAPRADEAPASELEAGQAAGRELAEATDEDWAYYLAEVAQRDAAKGN